MKAKIKRSKRNPLWPNSPGGLKFDPAQFRFKASCKIGRDALDGVISIPRDRTAIEYAMFNLLHAVEELGAKVDSLQHDIKKCGRGI